jgi:hypothetical protein
LLVAEIIGQMKSTVEISEQVGRANRRPASPLDAGRQFGSASCAAPSLSAAVAHLWRSVIANV